MNTNTPASGDAGTDMSTELHTEISGLRTRIAELAAIGRELRQAREELATEALYLGRLVAKVENWRDRHFWRRVLQATLIACLSAFVSSLTFLTFIWLYRHNLLPWW